MGSLSSNLLLHNLTKFDVLASCLLTNATSLMSESLQHYNINSACYIQYACNDVVVEACALRVSWFRHNSPLHLTDRRFKGTGSLIISHGIIFVVGAFFLHIFTNCLMKSFLIAASPTDPYNTWSQLRTLASRMKLHRFGWILPSS